MKMNQAGIDLLKNFEGLRLKSYLCSSGVPTIAYGATTYTNGMKVQLSDPPITVEHAEELLKYHVRVFEAGVSDLLDAPLNENQFSALVSFAYNCGLGNLKKSTLLALVNKGDIDGAAEQFLVWNKASGKVVEGLNRRRQAEKKLFTTPIKASQLPDGPTKDEIENKLKEVEKSLA